MAVYVDDFYTWEQSKYRGMRMSHMFADTPAELHGMARKLGLKREWFQDKSTPHYDVSITKRKKALELGAINLPIRSKTNRGKSRWREIRDRIRYQWQGGNDD